MKTNDPTVRKRMKWIGMILLAVVAALGFSCIVMAALILFAILSFLVF